MGIMKKILIGVLVVAVAGTGVTAGLMQIKKSNQKEVLVAKVENFTSEYYMPSTTLEGNVTTSVAQNINVDKDMIIDEVFVEKGDGVKKGDPLISFDTTLVEMELNIARLKHKQLEKDLHKAINRLNSLKNGGPIIEESDGGRPDADNVGDMDDMGMMSYLDGSGFGNYLAAALPNLLLAAFTDEAGADGGIFGEDDSSGEGSPEDGVYDPEQQAFDELMEGPEYQDPSAGDFTSGEDITSGEPDDEFGSGQEDIPKPSPTPTPILGDGIGYYDPYFKDGIPGITDGTEKFYDKLDADSAPFTGRGTKKDPFVFLVDSATGRVTAMGSFFNKMAGYSEDGTKVEKEGGYWYQLEFHQENTIVDYQDRKQSCIGYYLVNGSLLTKPVYMYTETDFTLAEAMRYEDEIPEGPDYPGGYNPNIPSMSRAEAIKIQKNKIEGLKLDIQESNIKVGQLEKKVNRKVMYSKLDGIVAYVGDPITGSSEGGAFIKVKSGDGFYVVGAVGELMLNEIQEGSILNCMSYESGNFQAEVMDVSEYPISGNMYSGMNNPNVSYYSFTAEVTDKTLKFSDYDYITITLESAKMDSSSLILQKAFVRTEDGKSYVYKDENGILKKQYLTVGGALDGGYNIMVKSGITKEDFIAFPYGKNVKEGAKTREATMDEMYGY